MVNDKSIDRLMEIRRTMEELAAEKERLESEIILSCQEELQNTKYKTLSYRTEAGNQAVVTLAESLKLVYPTMLKGIFGKAYPDMVKEETKYTLTAPAKRLMTNLWTGKYVRQTLDEAIARLPVEEGTRQKLAKKLKGVNFDTDKKHLMNLGGLSEEDAAEYAYLLCEAAVWQSFVTLMRLNEADTEADRQELLVKINTSMIVDETPKVSVSNAPSGLKE